MDVRCDKCQARYRIEDARVASAGPAGLSMRCGKCGNIFKITKDGAAAASSPGASKPPPAAAPSAPPPADLPGSTMMFQAPKIPPPKPAPVAATPAPSAPPPAELPGSTMMFQAPKIPPKPAPASAPPAAKPPGHTSDDDSGSTMMFGTAPIKLTDAAPEAKPPPAAPAPSAPPPKAAPKAAPAAAAPAADDGAGSTMMFGASPIAKPAPTAAKPPPPAAAKPAPAAPRPPPAAPTAPAPPPKKVEPATIPEPEPEAERPLLPSEEETASGNEAPEGAAEPSEPVQARAGESVGEDEVDPSAMTGEAGDLGADAIPHPPPRKKPLPKSVIYGGIGLGAAVVLVAIILGVVAHFGPHPPPAPAIKLLADARDLLDKDSLAIFPKALESDAAALAAAPKSAFPEAHALQAEIELAWSDALADDAQLLTDKSVRLDDDKKKAETDAAAQKATADSTAHGKTAFEAAKAGNTLVPTSPDVHLVLADYYRAAKSYPNYEREIKKAVAFKASEGRLEAVEGSKLLADDDGVEKGLAKLKAALAANPQSARIQYRIAQAYALLKNDAEEKKALDATLKLSPNHERAKLMLEAIKAAADAANPPPAPDDK